MSAHQDKRSTLHAGVVLLACAVVLFRLVSEAWVGEDAQITFRTIEHFVNGFGLRWNIDERVQVSTHPLWMLTNSIAYAVTREINFTVTGLGIVFTMGAFACVASHLKTHTLPTWICFSTLFVTSQTMMMYGTSGFETSLGFLLLSLFITELFKEGGARSPRWGLLSLWGGLLAFNRLDCVLIVAPPLAFLGIHHWRNIAWRRALLGFSPVLGWFAFSLAYYGFAFPNTAPAKLSADISGDAYLREGLLYAANIVRWDIVAVPVLIAFTFTAARAAIRFVRDRTDLTSGTVAALSAGTAVYALYVVRIGGGFLAGRFWAPVLFSAIVITAYGFRDLLAAIPKAKPGALIATGLTTLMVTVGIFQFAAHTDSWEKRGAIQDRSLAHVRLNTSAWAFEPSEQAQKWHKQGLRANKRAKKSPAKRFVVEKGTIGFFGRAAGPQVTIIDPFALADPLLARLPMKDPDDWMVGHLRRVIPAGYIPARRTGKLDKMDPSLREYYQHLRRITTAPVFSSKRWQTILDFHLGNYDHLIDEWKERQGNGAAKTTRHPSH